MSEMTEISAEVTGDDGFYYYECKRWGSLSTDQVAMVSAWLNDMAECALDLAGKGTGDLKAVLRQSGLPNVEPELVIEGFGKDDMAPFQHRFSNGWDRLVDLFADRRKGRWLK